MCQIRGNNAVQQAKMQLFLLHLLTRNLKITVPKTITAGIRNNRQDAKEFETAKKCQQNVPNKRPDSVCRIFSWRSWRLGVLGG